MTLNELFSKLISNPWHLAYVVGAVWALMLLRIFTRTINKGW